MKRDPAPYDIPALPPQPISVDVVREKYLKEGEAKIGRASCRERV